MTGTDVGGERYAERVRDILDTANDAFVAIDADGRIVDWNPQAERTFGYARRDAIGRSLAETLIPERYRAAHQAGLQRYLRTGEGPVLYQTVELSALRRDGGEFPIELTIWPTEHDGVTTFNAFVRDITDRKRSEGFVHLLRTIAVAANEARTVEEAFHRCLTEVCAFTGWPVGHVYDRVPGTDELVPTTIWCIDDPGRYERFRSVTESTPLRAGVGLPGRVITDGKAAWVTDVTKDPNFPRAKVATDLGVAGGFAFPVLAGPDVVAVLEFFSPRPEVPDAAMLDVMADIGAQLGRVVERQRAFDALQDAFDRLRAAEELKDMFLEGVSHDLRTPLSVVLGMASLLLEHEDRIGEPLRAELTRRLHAGATRLEHVLSELLDLQRIARGSLRPHREPVDLVPVVERAVELGDPGDRTVTIEVTTMRIDVDRALLERAIANLVRNAARHTPEGTPVWIRTVDDDAALHLVVEDAGPGVADELRDRIFEPFVRGDPADPKPGTGIGLALVKRFVQLHGGDVWVRHRTGGGAAFHVRIPGA